MACTVYWATSECVSVRNLPVVVYFVVLLGQIRRGLNIRAAWQVGLYLTEATSAAEPISFRS